MHRPSVGIVNLVVEIGRNKNETIEIGYILVVPRAVKNHKTGLRTFPIAQYVFRPELEEDSF